MMKNSTWMASLPDETMITKINMPGTHDSTACFVDFSFISQTQALSVEKQLSVGVRYFDFRFKFEKNEFLASHSIAYCKTNRGVNARVITGDDVVRYCSDFLKKNPTETLLFQLKQNVSSTGDEFYTAFYERYVKTDPDLWYVSNSIPTLGDVRGKIVLLRAVGIDKSRFDDSNSGIDFGAYPYVGTRLIDDWRTSEICSVKSSQPYAEMLVQDSYKLEGKRKWATVTRFLENSDKRDFNICLTSCTFLFVPRINVRYINKKLKNYSFEQGKLYGIVASDFIDSKICSKIIASNVFD